MVLVKCFVRFLVFWSHGNEGSVEIVCGDCILEMARGRFALEPLLVLGYGMT